MFTVVIPVYNHALFLESAILSAIRSNLVHEILLVDDGSKDESAQVIERMARVWPDRVKNLTEPERSNKGAHERLNQLCRAASCEWIAVLNSDDEFLPGRFEFLKTLIRNNDPDFVCGTLLIMDNSGGIIGGKRGIRDMEYDFPASLKAVEPIDTLNIRRALCSQNFIATTSNMVFRRDLFDRIGGFSNLRYAHDWDFALRATMLGKCLFTPNPLTKYRIHLSNTIREATSHVDGEVVRLFARVLADFPQIEQDAICRESLASNLHFGPYDPPATPETKLPVTSSDRPLRFGFCSEKCTAPGDTDLPVNLVHIAPQEISSSWDKIDFLYAPEQTSAENRVWGNAIFCLAHHDYDFVLFAESFDELPQIKMGSLRDHVVFNQRAARYFIEGKSPASPLRGRLIRYVPAVDKPAQETDIRKVLGQHSVEWKGSDLLVKKARALVPLSREAAVRTVQASLPTKFGNKPLVLVLPIFLAVGGVERNTIEVLRRLRNQYDFFVVTNERHAKHHGSLHYQLDELGIRSIDLAEIAEPDQHIHLLENMATGMSPELVWICNGSPWLLKHTTDIRRIFAWSAIVDQQVYDINEGWMAHYHHKGIQSFDQFIAINQKIFQKFVDQLRIPRTKVCLIYPAINSAKLAESQGKLRGRELLREEHGLPKGGFCFGFIGRLTHQKQPLHFLDLALRAQKAGLDDHFLLAGQGVLAEECDAFIKTHQLRCVTRLPFFNDVSVIAEMIDGLIITSDYEGLPIALLEILALGRPALATDVGDIKVVLDQYGSGKIFKTSADADSRWEDFLDWRADIQTYRSKAGQHSTAVLKRFSIDRIAGQYDEVWTRAMEELRVAPRLRKQTT